MTLENINYIAQTIGVFAILASLLFVARQLQQSQKIERAAAQRDLLARVSEFSWKITPIAAEGDLFVKGLMDFDDAPARQQAFFASALADFVFITESAFYMHKDGFLTDGTWRGIEGGALSLLRSPGGAQWWRYGRTYIGADIVAHLDKRLGEIDPSAPTFIDILPTYRKRLEELRALEAEGGSPSPGS
ncbi:MAG: hypothetical protein ABL889_18780 [Terricaulis sp.]